MKKTLLGLISIIFVGQLAFSQPVSDQAVIPMAITVNSILRLNVVSGGNIEFVFNTISEYQSGLSGSRYTTTITVASSGNWALDLDASTANFVSDGAAGIIPLDYVVYNLTNNGATYTIGAAAGTDNTVYNADVAGVGTPSAPAVYSDLTQTPGFHVLESGIGNAGGISENNFDINWECGTGNGTTQSGNTISDAGATTGRYSTNILLSLIAL